MQEFNRELVPIKILYFLSYAGAVSFRPFKSIFQKQLGMSTSQNGIIQSVHFLMSLISPPIAGYIADKTKAYKAAMTVCIFLCMIFSISFYFIPSVESETLRKNVTCCLSSLSRKYSCPKSPSPTNCKLFNSSVEVNVSFTNEICNYPGVVLLCDNIDHSDDYGMTFALLISLTGLTSLFYGPILGLVDSSALDKLGIKNIKYFGVQRLWGALAHAVVGFGVGYLVDIEQSKLVDDTSAQIYLPCFIGVGVFWSLTILLILISVDATVPKAVALSSVIKNVLIEPRILAFLGVILVNDFVEGVRNSFLFWYLEELDGYEAGILGITILLSCLTEIPMYWCSGWICEKFGYASVLGLGLLSNSIRCFTYTMITNAWQVLLIEWLHGISHALPEAAIRSYSAVIAPQNVATLISINTVVHGLGATLGALFGGMLYESFGGATTFLISCVVSLTVAISFELFFGCLNLFSYFRKEKPEVQRKETAASETRSLLSNEQNP